MVATRSILNQYIFLKKAFGSKEDQDQVVTVNYYCQDCFSGPLQSGQNVCRVCGNNNLSKGRNYFLTLDIAGQIKQMYQDKSFAKDLEYGFEAREHSAQSLDKTRAREWNDVMDGELYKELLKPGGFLTSKNNLSLLFNTDGVHAFKASRDEIWPLLLVINEVHPSVRFSSKRMILGGMWFGPGKPSMTTFLAPIRKMLNSLKKDGISMEIDGKSSICRAVCLLGATDLPGKSAVQAFTQFNGMCGCSFCEEEGEVVSVGKGHSRCYPYTVGPPKNLRTIDSVLKQANEAQLTGLPVRGVKHMSQLGLIDGFDMVNGMPLDYMHGVLLGVVKMLFTLWFDNKHKKENFYIGQKISIIDERLSKCQPPDFISRLPRSLVKDRKYWKASEVRSWLLYYSLPVLKGILPDDYYCHYALLVTSIYLLLQHPVTETSLLMADKQLEEFYCLTEIYYGKKSCTINMHNTCKHLTSSVKLAGPLWVFSCFGFESWNGTMTKLIHGTHHVAVQVVAAVKTMQRIAALETTTASNCSENLIFFMTTLDKSKRNNVVNVFPGCHSVGSLTKVTLTTIEKANLNEVIPGAAVNTQEAYYFKKVIWKNTMFYSMACEKVKKRNSFTITFTTNNGEERVAQIVNFVKVVVKNGDENVSYFLAAINEMRPFPDEGIMANVLVSSHNKELGHHLQPYHKERNTEHVSYIPIDNIGEKLVAVGCLSSVIYVCKAPNFWETD